jgi:hypothetical protein
LVSVQHNGVFEQSVAIPFPATDTGKISKYMSGMANAPWWKTNLLASDEGKKVFISIFYLLSILCFVVLFVTIGVDSCKRPVESFDDIPTLSAVSERAASLKKSVDAVYKRVCALDDFVGTGVAANFETTLNLKVGLVPKDEFEAGRPARQREAAAKTAAQKSEAVGKDCNGGPLVMECFEDIGDWKILEKDIRKTLQRLRIASITLFKWISPNTRGFAKTGQIEGFAAKASALEVFMDTCPLTPPVAEKDTIPADYKTGLWSMLETSEKYLPDIMKEIVFLEKIKQKLKEKKERLERGELSDEDLKMGENTTQSL